MAPRISAFRSAEMWTRRILPCSLGFVLLVERELDREIGLDEVFVTRAAGLVALFFAAPGEDFFFFGSSIANFSRETFVGLAILLDEFLIVLPVNF